ncbi:MAG TPA: VWA domain-containing protein [Terriglobales bacterium]|nr:VWA domain-containing protein [Terriglobales bacterium]
MKVLAARHVGVLLELLDLKLKGTGARSMKALGQSILVLVFGVLAHGQATKMASATGGSSSPQGPVVTFEVSTRMVTVEVVARDHRGHFIPGLTSRDFQVFEQVPPKSKQYAQNIAALQAVSVSQLAAQSKGDLQVPSGVYTNLVSKQKVPVPSTALLVDGINTDFASHAQVHIQMARMLASIPADIPVAVFLLGRRLRMVQNFTTDPKLLKSALQTATGGLPNQTQINPGDDPDSTSAFLEGRPGFSELQGSVLRFEQETFAYSLDVRVKTTLAALQALAGYIAGYPGRKNLLWISSSFPISIGPESGHGLVGIRNYQSQIAAVTNALADAKVAVYPIDPAGVETYSFFQAGNSSGGDPATMISAMNREDQARKSRRLAMEQLARQTGGKVCTSDNDLGDCVKKAVEDGSSFYEIAYYPNTGAWHGEFHRIIVKTRQSGSLAYRQGYYASVESVPVGKDQKEGGAGLEWAACVDPLTSTSILMMAKEIPTDKAGRVKYLVAVDPETISFTPASDGSRDLTLNVAVCTFNKNGKPLQFVENAISRRLTEKEFVAVQVQHRFSHTFVLAPAVGTVAVRLLVEDVITGRLGSMNVPYIEPTSPALP